MLARFAPTSTAARRWPLLAPAVTIATGASIGVRWAPLGLVIAATAANWSPYALLVLAAAFRLTRRAVVLVILVGLNAALLADHRRQDPSHRQALPWASALPVALCFAWGTIPEPPLRPALGSCTDPLSPPATWRALEGALILGVTATLIRVGGREPLLVRRPQGRRVLVLAAIAPLGVVPAVVAGPSVAGLFFGAPDVAFPPGSFVPAALLASSNGALEEVAYRGALLGWGGRAIGPRKALLVQAAVFGFAHWGPGMTGAMPILIFVSLGACGLVIGLVARRTGSLLLPISAHAAVDVPLYHLAACSLG